MGADQIGYLVKGPAKLDPSKFDDAAKAVASVRDQAKSLLDILGKEAEATDDSEWGLPEWLTELYDNLGRMGIEDIASIDTAEWVRRFAKFWDTEDGRDVACRLDPDDRDQKIMFAGAMSWGDEPDGHGYLMLRDALRYGVFDTFGIR